MNPLGRHKIGSGGRVLGEQDGAAQQAENGALHGGLPVEVYAKRGTTGNHNKTVMTRKMARNLSDGAAMGGRDETFNNMASIRLDVPSLGIKGRLGGVFQKTIFPGPGETQSGLFPFL